MRDYRKSLYPGPDDVVSSINYKARRGGITPAVSRTRLHSRSEACYSSDPRDFGAQALAKFRLPSVTPNIVPRFAPQQLAIQLEPCTPFLKSMSNIHLSWLAFT